MLSKCIFCKRTPQVVHFDDNMWYVMCDCGKYQKYEFLGFTRQGAEERWEYANRPMNRTPPPRKERKDDSKSKKKNTN